MTDAHCFKTASGYLCQHGCEQEGISITDQGQRDRWISTERPLQVLGSRHSCETTTDDHNSCLDHSLWQGWLICFSQEAGCHIAQCLCDQPYARAIQHPANECRKKYAHALSAPLRRLTREQREKNNTDTSPKHNTCCRRCQSTIGIGMRSRAKGQSIDATHEQGQQYSCQTGMQC